MGLGEAPESWGTGKHCQDLLWGIRGPDLPPGHRCIPHLQRHQAGWDARPEGAPFSSSTPPIQLPVSTGSDPLHQCPEVVLSFFLNSRGPTWFQATIRKRPPRRGHGEPPGPRPHALPPFLSVEPQPRPGASCPTSAISYSGPSISVAK